MEKEAETKKELIEDLADLRQQLADMKKSRSETKNFPQALQASEARYRRLFETAQDEMRLIDALPVPVFCKDSEGRFLGCNSSFEKLFGQKREQVTGKSVYELSPKESADLYYEKDLVLLQNPGIQIYESTVKDTGGVVHDVIFHKATFPNMDGSVGGLIGAVLDITDRKQVVARIRKALGATIQAIAVTVEARDPYTAAINGGWLIWLVPLPRR
jgi:PAS domain S-box-containing protein